MGLGALTCASTFQQFVFPLKFIEYIDVWVCIDTKRPPMDAPFMSPILTNLTSRRQ